MSQNRPDKKEVVRILKENIDIIKSFGVRKISIFGSVAQGNAKVDSDIDILVEFEEDKKTLKTS